MIPKMPRKKSLFDKCREGVKNRDSGSILFIIQLHTGAFERIKSGAICVDGNIANEIFKRE